MLTPTTPDANAILSWVPPEEGGRRSPLVGPTYCTVVKFEDDERFGDEAWSLFVQFVRPLRGGRHAHVNVRFLVEEAPHHLLRPGSRFELLEGRRRVAKGVVLPKNVQVPEELNELEAALIG